MTLDDTLRAEYIKLFAECSINPAHEPDVEHFINQLMLGVSNYEETERSTKVPWFVIGLIHGMECDFSFNEHLHNGDSLKHRTVNEPAGRPPPSVGDPPFSWNLSAIDALAYDSMMTWKDWSIAGICFKLEAYNGWGYRKHAVNSPYLWSYSNNYRSGKYIADGLWSGDAISKQVGAITALKRMIDDHLVSLEEKVLTPKSQS
jgi:lysozyme family protein